MRIQRIRVWRVDLALTEGRYGWGGGRYVDSLDSTVVAVDSDTGITGWGEVCPLGAAYLPAFATGARAAIAELAPLLIGEDPRQVGRLGHLMDKTLKGHNYAKAPLDVAFWDLAARAAGLPVSVLLGGRHTERLDLMRALTIDAPEKMAAKAVAERAKGFKIFQMKVGEEPGDDAERVRAVRKALGPGIRLVVDANASWRADQAIRFCRMIGDQDVYVEQPCPSYEECLKVRRSTSLPFLLDECLLTVEDVLRAHSDGAMDAMGMKISRMGGFTKSRLVRDLCAHLGIPFTSTESWGGDIVTATVNQFAAATPADVRFWSFNFNSYVTPGFADHAPKAEGGEMPVSTRPGLGLEPDAKKLGTPLAEYA